MSTPVFNQAPTVQNRPIARKDAQGNLIPGFFDDLSFRGIYAGTNIIYKGFARVGASTSEPVWQISYITYDGSNNILSITWPQDVNGNACNDYQFIWDDYAGYTYS